MEDGPGDVHRASSSRDRREGGRLPWDVASGFDPTDCAMFQALFGMIFTLIIALEFKRSLLVMAERRESVVRVRAVILIALLAIVRTLLILAIRTGASVPDGWAHTDKKEVPMTIRKLDKKEWKLFFDRVSKIMEGKQAEIEVASLTLGDQLEAEWPPLIGLTYDPKDDVFEVALEGVDHLISKPREIYVDGSPVELNGLEVIDAEGVKQIVKLRDPLMLPAPHG
jgi:hypothetical protein